MEIVIFLALMGLVLWRIFFYVDQWMMLAAEYQTTWEDGPSVNCWISLRFPPFRQTMNKAGEISDGRLTVTPRGLQIHRHFFWNPCRQPLLIPWDDLTVIGRRGRYEYEGGGVFLCFAKVPKVRMWISGSAVEALLKAGTPWYINSEGTIMAKDHSLQS